MQAFDPRKRATKEKRKPRIKKRPLISVLAFISICLLIFGLYSQKSDAPSKDKSQNAINQNVQIPQKKGVLKNFTGEQFKELYNNFAYPNTERINEDTPITGNTDADVRIRDIAEERGYQLRSAPVTNAFVEVAPGYKLQQRAAGPWQDLKAAAKKDGINIGLTAAYRSADEQKEIFMSRLSVLGIPTYLISSGSYDSQISQVLRTTAIPGYSRHHTGYTVDISCEDQPQSSFEYTTCFKWLHDDNYKNAKLNGWIPSYPEGTGNQGPDPESWEYVWVGKDALTK